MTPRFSEHILPVPWPFIISRFHCNTFLVPQVETYFLHADIIANIFSILGFKEAPSFELVFNWRRTGKFIIMWFILNC